MKFRLRFADSEVSGVEVVGRALVVRFSAAEVERLDDGEAARGYVRSLQMVFVDARWSGALGDAIGRLAAVSLDLGGEPLGAVIVPLQHPGRVVAEFAFSNRATLNVEAASVSLEFRGEPGFVESFAC